MPYKVWKPRSGFKLKPTLHEWFPTVPHHVPNDKLPLYSERPRHFSLLRVTERSGSDLLSECYLYLISTDTPFQKRTAKKEPYLDLDTNTHTSPTWMPGTLVHLIYIHGFQGEEFAHFDVADRPDEDERKRYHISSEGQGTSEVGALIDLVSYHDSRSQNTCKSASKR